MSKTSKRRLNRPGRSRKPPVGYSPHKHRADEYYWSAPDFSGLRAANKSRVVRWHGPKGVDDWSITDWSNAVAGETGEMCNAIKKLRRIQHKLPNISAPGRQLASAAEALDAIGLEMADIVIYLDLLALKLNLWIPTFVARKFNQKSEEYGFPERLI